jgi:sugar lactone lactonase YvrE
MTLLASGSPYLLIADSVLGVVWRLNHLTSKYEIALESPLMQPPTGPVLLGINGIHVFDSFVYFTNSFQKLFARVPVNLQGPDAGLATGDYEIVANNGFGDDFTFDKEGTAYITQDPGNGLELVNQEGKVTLLAGNVNSTIVEGDTADAFGRTKWDEDILYVVTNGGIAGPVPGTKITGGKVIAVDVQALLSP